ncbi:NEL-type E3 ubiquitin ligase domain-containing protein [Pseudomonas sp. NPDC089408]|uniref:NEL-type E3 ubiquitin ligase domain-containing protein n=1 Tax=Pseudomonas sp. NPDC089408 TaxID=3364465 RepID=UPI0037FBA3C4
MRQFAASPTPLVYRLEDEQRATDRFILQRLPGWLRKATPGQIADLRRLIAAHNVSQQRVQAAMQPVASLQQFAVSELTQALSRFLPPGESLDRLQWRDKEVELLGVSLPHLQYSYKPSPALSRLMQNFAAGATPLDGSGLYDPATQTLVSDDVDALVDACRHLDAGARYQALLADHFTRHRALLVEDKLAALALAMQLALMHGQIDLSTQAALQACFDPAASSQQDQQQAPAAVTAYPGLMSLLGYTVHEALCIQLRGADDSDLGVIVYLADGSACPLRRYASKLALEQELVRQLSTAQYLATFSQRVALSDRKAFLDQLALRLADAQPDLAVEGEAGHDAICERWVTAQVDRAKQDARVLLVPTADADAKASQERLAAWGSAGWTLASLAGFFVPLVGAALLADLLRQVCSHTYEGMADWAAGHDHEALQHLLGVAQIVAGAAITVGAVAGAGAAVRLVQRSAFVDGLVPVSLDAGGARLWHDDLTVYATRAQPAQLDERGLYSTDQRHWLRIADNYYALQQPQAQGGWRLRHPLREGAYGPALAYNGERYWHLPVEQPAGWADAAQMLNRLWPQAQPLDTQWAQTILQAAGSDVDELRGILVDNRPLPANLRDALRRFAADRRLQAFFVALDDAAAEPDGELLAYCRQLPQFAGIADAKLPAAIVEQGSALREGLFAHLTPQPKTDDRVAGVLLRDFPGLPVDYALELANAVTGEQRQRIELLQRLPLSVAKKARGLLQMARLSRAQQGLMLRNAYSSESGELLLRLLPQLANWSFGRRLELRARTASGQLTAVLNSQAPEATAVILVRAQGLFKLYDYRGEVLDAQFEATDDVFAALAAVLTAEQQKRLRLDPVNPASDLRQRVVRAIPATPAQLLNRLGWRQQQGWFNPGQRLPDGRVGYLLGGQQSTTRNYQGQLRMRLRNLYHGNSEVEIDEHLHRISRSDDPFAAMLFEEDNFRLLNHRMNEWIAYARPSEVAARRMLAARLRQAWRRQLPLDTMHAQLGGRILDLSGFQVSSLPELAESIDFNFVTTLVMINTPLVVEPNEFFSCFSEVRRLNFSRNHLHRVPTGLQHLVNLESLQLSYNCIRMNVRGIETLRGLQHLTELDLSANPLQHLTLRFNQAPRLQTLYLRNCRLLEWPAGLERCAELNMADLRCNQIAEVPQAILQMPYAFRMAFHVQHNPIAAQQWAGLHAPPAHVAHAVTAMQAQVPARQLWLGETATQAQRERWLRLFGVPGRERVLHVLQALQNTRDYERHRADLTLQVWALLEALDEDTDLLARVVALAEEETTCADSIAERFSDMRLQALVAQASRVSGDKQTALLQLGLGLFRLERLQTFVRMDIATRQSVHRLLDPIEVKLSYTVALAQEMNLPGQPTSIRYGELANVSAAQLEAARTFVREAETVEAQAEFLALHSFWSGWVESQHQLRFEALDTRYADMADALTAEAGQGAGAPEAQATWDELEYARTAERIKMIVEYTKEILEGRTGNVD